MTKYLIVFAVTVLGVFAFPNIQREGLRSGRIVGGKDAPEGAFPYIVSLQESGYHFCGGSIIKDTVVVTAAHCVQGSSPSYVTVVAGVTKLSKGGDEYKVSRFISHPSGDIALVILQEPIQFSDNVQTIDWEKELKDETRDSVASGWGANGTSSPDHLQYVDLKAISNEECRSRGQRVKDEDICTFTKAGEGTCFGDSGGPLVSEGKLIGCVSRGVPCAVGYPDIFTRLSHFSDWIEQNIGGSK